MEEIDLTLTDESEEIEIPAPTEDPKNPVFFESDNEFYCFD